MARVGDGAGLQLGVMLAQDRVPEAIASLEQATATSEPEPFIELAAAYLRANRIAKARDAASEALRRSPGHPWAMALLGRALILHGQGPQGLEYLQRAVAIRPRRPVVWAALAAGFDAAGQAGLAAQCRREWTALTDAIRP